MFERRKKIKNIQAEINRLLSHKEWDTSRRYWDDTSISEFLSELENPRPTRDESPFSRNTWEFNAEQAAREFLKKMLKDLIRQLTRSDIGIFVFPSEAMQRRRRYEAEEIARVLGVNLPSNSMQGLSFVSSTSEDWPPAAEDWPILPKPSEPSFAARLPFHDVSKLSVTDKSAAYPIPEKPGVSTVATGMSDEKRLASLQALIVHPNTPPGERQAALEAYGRLKSRPAK